MTSAIKQEKKRQRAVARTYVAAEPNRARAARRPLPVSTVEGQALAALVADTLQVTATPDAETVRQARAVLTMVRAGLYVAENAPAPTSSMDLLTAPSGQPKLAMNAAYTMGLVLAPAHASGLQACPWATACVAPCVTETTGHARIARDTAAANGSVNANRIARIARTLFVARFPRLAVALLAHEIALAEGRAKRKGLPLAVRLNVASDVRWEMLAPGLFARFPGVTFYDYTKAPAAHRLMRPGNYVVTYSINERRRSLVHAAEYLQQGATATAVVTVDKGVPFPATLAGLPVVDGDATDNRAADAAGSLVLLRLKGDSEAKRDAVESGFAWDVDALGQALGDVLA